MIDVKFTEREMRVFLDTVIEYRDNFESYPGSQMVLTDAEEFTELANAFVAAVPSSGRNDRGAPDHPFQPDDGEIRIAKIERGYHIKAHKYFDILVATSITYEHSIISDTASPHLLQNREVLRSIIVKFSDAYRASQPTGRRS